MSKNLFKKQWIESSFRVFQEQFTKAVYDSCSTENEVKKITFSDKKKLLKPKATREAQTLPLVMSYSCAHPNNLKQIRSNKALDKTFSIEPMIPFRKNKSLKQVIRGNTIKNNKNIKKSNNTYEVQFTPYKHRIRSLLFTGTKQTLFRSKHNGGMFITFHRVN